MHIGLNLIFLVPGQTGGTEIYTRELIPRLMGALPDARFTAFINAEAAADPAPAPWRTPEVNTVQVPVHATSRVQWVRGEQLLLPGLAEHHRVDVMHSLANTGPARGHFARVQTVHDLHFKLVPEAHLGLVSLGMGVLVPLAARRANRVVASSRATGEDLVTHLNIPADKIDVVPLAFAGSGGATPLPEADLRAWLGVAASRPIALSVSAKRPHKNLARLITALALIPQERRPLLVIPGYSTSYEAELQTHAEHLGVLEDIRLLNWVTQPQLEGLYAGATCLVCASLHEGFGLPVLEAMARDLAVACSDGGALAEVGGDAVERFDPLIPRSLAAAIERLLGDPARRAELIALGRERVAEFTWERTAEGTAHSYLRALTPDS